MQQKSIFLHLSMLLLIIPPSFWHVFSCPFAPHEVSATSVRKHNETLWNTTAAPPQISACVSHMVMKLILTLKCSGMANAEDRGLQTDATTCWTGYCAINATLFHSLPPSCQAVIVAIAR